MANADKPIGFSPARGIGSQHVMSLFRVDVTNSTALYVGDVVDLDGSGAIPAAADAGLSVVGVAVALYDSDMNPVGSPNSSVSTKYLTTTTAGYVLVALAIPGAVFISQLDDGVPTNDDVGLTCDHIATAGDATTATSRHELDYDSGGVQFRIIGLVKEPQNSWGAQCDVYVVFNESALGCSGEASV